MRIDKALCSLALLALAGASAPAETVDPNNDFDCAAAFGFFHRMAKAKQLAPDLIEETAIMNAWFGGKWEQDHPGEGAKQFDNYNAMVKAMGENPAAYGDVLKTCSARANADPVFQVFATELRKSAPPQR